jgi:hypothetical protein
MIVVAGVERLTQAHLQSQRVHKSQVVRPILPARAREQVLQRNRALQEMG